MSQRSLRAVRPILASGLLFLASTAGAVSIHDESVDGDLSDDRLNPTAAQLAPGSNTLTATTVVGDLEFLTVNVPAGQSLVALILDSFVGLDDIMFVAVQNGATFTEDLATLDTSQLLGMTHFGSSPTVAGIGTDILDDIGLGFNFVQPPVIGFTGPLPAGDYTFWFNQTGAAATTFTVDFVVPEPGAALLAMAGLLGLGLAGRRAR